ncbi:hypothetical protein GS845_13465 [Rhodococcus hoagii]|nr:hypothetical protein [Prescottella equi]
MSMADCVRHGGVESRGVFHDDLVQPHHRVLAGQSRVRALLHRAVRSSRPRGGRSVPGGSSRHGVTLDFATSPVDVLAQHYAFLVSEADFDSIYGRIRARGMEHWADPRKTRPGEINHNDGGRGVYFHDPDGHNLEIITRPYGSGG